MQQKGFTLLELLVVMLIIGILSAIAYPSYTQYVLKARRTQAKVNLMALAAEMESRYTVQHRYEISNPVMQQEFYHYLIQLNNNGYMISAQPQGTQQADECGTLSVNELGQQFTDNGAAKDCW